MTIEKTNHLRGVNGERLQRSIKDASKSTINSTNKTHHIFYLKQKVSRNGVEKKKEKFSSVGRLNKVSPPSLGQNMYRMKKEQLSRSHNLTNNNKIKSRNNKMKEKEKEKE
eukprot:CAMPEP_0201541722 /NCGR_PEP_ID=MMETSP0161_2-20130828/71627_1 /ASSEMBLY_ACC=CAM_ASM_000251 /TAXON_ID=180227 /ORGANISM="Neoparamoeba aestuarina, Strain SoJaBio B1-5/56/2" /LENGTH=110 /DNA_ID=CAMNT_0047949279 /DNA_START=1931 /DNA_END=2260 /DNA_ORIENTATION=-